MIEKWIASVFWKRVGLAGAAVVVAQWAAHSVPVTDHLAAWGIAITLHIDQNQLATHLTTTLVALSQGLHEWLAVKYPELGKYL